LCANIFGTPSPPNTPTENNRKGLNSVRLVAIKILPRIAQGSSSTGLSRRKLQENNEVWHSWCEFYHQLVETRLNSLKCRIPSRKCQIQHTADWGTDQKWLDHRRMRDPIFGRTTYCKSLWMPCVGTFCLIIQAEVCFIGEPCDIQESRTVLQ
jgi:hypothetical protein